jgi:hypothetical protein
MKTIGLAGGSLLSELGSKTDIHLFFDCLNTYVVAKHLEQDWSLLSDRLYKRYLRLNELDAALALMEQVRKKFAALPSNAIDWQDYEETNAATNNRLDTSKGTLADVFERFFENFVRCCESAKNSYEMFKSYAGYKYEPVRFIVTDIPWFTAENMRPLEEYDALDGEPFWTR